MELRHLRYFVAVAETLNFREAAESLHLSTPGLSKQIKDLEEELGVRLLDRNTTQVRLTDAGAVFLGEARGILAHASRAIELAQAAAKGQRGHLAIGNIGSLTANYMATCLTTYCARYPDVDVELIDMDIPSQIAALSKRKIQVGFIPAQSLPSLPGNLQHVSVLTAPLCAVLPRGHRLAERSSVSLADLAREKLLVIGGKPSLHGSYLRTLLGNRGLKPQRMAEVQGFESLLAMVAGGQGVSILAGRGSVMRVEDIIVRPLKETGPDTEVEICAVWHDGEAAVLARNFINVFRGLIPSKKQLLPPPPTERNRTKSRS